MLGNENLFLKSRGPAEDGLQTLYVRIGRIQLHDPGNGLDAQPPALLQRDGAAVVGNDSLRLIDDGLQHAFLVQRRSDFMADTDQRMQDLHLAFGFQHRRIVQSIAGSFADIGKQKLIVFVERQAISAV